MFRLGLIGLDGLGSEAEDIYIIIVTLIFFFLKKGVPNEIAEDGQCKRTILLQIKPKPQYKDANLRQHLNLYKIH